MSHWNDVFASTKMRINSTDRCIFLTTLKQDKQEQIFLKLISIWPIIHRSWLFFRSLTLRNMRLTMNNRFVFIAYSILSYWTDTCQQCFLKTHTFFFWFIFINIVRVQSFLSDDYWIVRESREESNFLEDMIIWEIFLLIVSFWFILFLYSSTQRLWSAMEKWKSVFNQSINATEQKRNSLNSQNSWTKSVRSV